MGTRRIKTAAALACKSACIVFSLGLKRWVRANTLRTYNVYRMRILRTPPQPRTVRRRLNQKRSARYNLGSYLKATIGTDV